MPDWCRRGETFHRALRHRQRDSLQIGYERYLKHGQAFKMRNYIEELPPQVYLPLKYLDEVKSAPQGKLSFPYFSRCQRYWLTAKTLGAAELSRNDEWLGITIGVTQTSMAAAHALRASWPWWTRWLARYVFPPVKKVLADRARAAEILRPILEERLLAQNQLFYAMAAIHSSTAILLSILYDLIDERHEHAKADLVGEIEQVHKEFGSWSRQAASKLVKLDSFMKESQRIHYVGHARVTRAAQVPFTFNDGLHLPKGTMIQLLHSGFQQDPDFFEDPETFDPWRFLEKRQEGDPNRFQFASLSEAETTFGAGFHACPKRNYATDIIKLVLVHLLTNYDIKYDSDTQRRPPQMAHDSATLPSLATSILYREKVSRVQSSKSV
ncbi:cytochrome P450 [Schizothecium vesticola]|uniref:Cytochrome P450 n=1 Tax=Schizothecium vesticola TaxID=314040 RepID=A0AA40F0D5_9PEZI|nr:cytochrome P450 [Schizothecium vesticola]